MFLFIDPPLRPSKEGNFRYSIFFNLLAIIVYRQTLIRGLLHIHREVGLMNDDDFFTPLLTKTFP
jgi:hypothetical protein